MVHERASPTSLRFRRVNRGRPRRQEPAAGSSPSASGSHSLCRLPPYRSWRTRVVERDRRFDPHPSGGSPPHFTSPFRGMTEVANRANVRSAWRPQPRAGRLGGGGAAAPPPVAFLFGPKPSARVNAGRRTLGASPRRAFACGWRRGSEPYELRRLAGSLDRRRRTLRRRGAALPVPRPGDLRPMVLRRPRPPPGDGRRRQPHGETAAQRGLPRVAPVESTVTGVVGEVLTGPPTGAEQQPPRRFPRGRWRRRVRTQPSATGAARRVFLELGRKEQLFRRPHDRRGP